MLAAGWRDRASATDDHQAAVQRQPAGGGPAAVGGARTVTWLVSENSVASDTHCGSGGSCSSFRSCTIRLRQPKRWNAPVATHG